MRNSRQHRRGYGRWARDETSHQIESRRDLRPAYRSAELVSPDEVRRCQRMQPSQRLQRRTPPTPHNAGRATLKRLRNTQCPSQNRVDYRGTDFDAATVKCRGATRAAHRRLRRRDGPLAEVGAMAVSLSQRDARGFGGLRKPGHFEKRGQRITTRPPLRPNLSHGRPR